MRLYNSDWLPEHVMVRGKKYSIELVSDFKNKKILADSNKKKRRIRILQGQTYKATMRCLIHELIHVVFEFEGGLWIPHKLTYQMEKPILRLLLQNNLFIRR